MTRWQRLIGWIGKEDCVSATWLQQQDRDGWRTGFEGVSWRWPIRRE